MSSCGTRAAQTTGDRADGLTPSPLQHALVLSIACLGIAAIVTQMLAVREFLNIFSGNELTLGIILGNWLLLTGLGSFLGRHASHLRDRIRWLVMAQAGVAVVPAVQIGAIRLVKHLLVPGLMVGIGDVFWTSLVLLSPFCLISGFLLTLYAGTTWTRRGPTQVGDVYAVDSLGGIVGGLAFSFCLVHLFTPFQIATFVLVLNLLAAAHVCRASGRRSLGASMLAVLAGVLVLLGVTDLERRTGRAMFPGLEVVFQRSTPYGNLAVARQQGQITVYQNGVPIGSTQDDAAAEEVVHYALAQHPDPQRVLLLSGGLLGAHREIEKYPVERVDYVELDPAVLALAESIAGAGNDPRLRLIAADARHYVRQMRDTYDAILMALPDPSSAQLNRFYTAEFFAEVRRALRPGGVFSLSLTGAENYASPEARLLASAVHRALSSVFETTLLIPGTRQYVVASGGPLDHDIAARLAERGIATRYVRAEYLAAKLTPDRLAAASRMVAAEVSPNRDFHPGSYYAHLRYWLGHFGGGMLLPVLVVGALLVLIGGLLAGSPRPMVPAALCASGFAGMGLEVVLLIAFQTLHGYLYEQVALIVTGFMAGAAVGAWWGGRHGGDPAGLMLRVDTLLAVAAFLLVPLLLLLRSSESALLQQVSPALIFPLLNGVVGFLVGAQLPAAARLTFRTADETAASVYAFDFLGACLGALVVSAFCLPLLGIVATCGLLGGVKSLSAAGLRIRRAALAPLAAVAPARATGAVLTFGAVLLVLAGVGMAIVAEETSGAIYALSFTPAYYWALAGLAALGILRAIGIRTVAAQGGKVRPALRRWAVAVRESTRVDVLRWTYFLAFALAVFYPIFRCYFRIPYLFCHVCPRKCIFGFVRPWAVPAALIMNLESRSWCHRACPIGTLFDSQAHVCRHSGHGPGWLRAVSIGVLAFTAIAYFKIMWDLDAPPAAAWDWYTAFSHNTFAVSTAVVVIAAALIALASRVRRSFCNTLCPVGTFSNLLLRAERTLSRKSLASGRATDLARSEVAGR